MRVGKGVVFQVHALGQSSGCSWGGVPQDPGSRPGHWPAASASRPISPLSGLGQAARHTRPLIGWQALLPCIESGRPVGFCPSQGSFPFSAEGSNVFGVCDSAERCKDLTSGPTRGCQLPHTKVPTHTRQREVTRARSWPQGRRAYHLSHTHQRLFVSRQEAQLAETQRRRVAGDAEDNQLQLKPTARLAGPHLTDCRGWDVLVMMVAAVMGHSACLDRGQSFHPVPCKRGGKKNVSFLPVILVNVADSPRASRAAKRRG
jgi:hypothetical protein